MIWKDHLNLEQHNSDLSLTHSNGYPRSHPNPTSSMEDGKCRIRKAGYWVLFFFFFEESRKERTFLGAAFVLFSPYGQLVRYSESSRIGEKRKLAHWKSFLTCQLQDILKLEKRILIEGWSYWPIDRDSLPSLLTSFLGLSLGLEERKELDQQLLLQLVRIPLHLSLIPLPA